MTDQESKEHDELFKAQRLLALGYHACQCQVIGMFVALNCLFTSQDAFDSMMLFPLAPTSAALTVMTGLNPRSLARPTPWRRHVRLLLLLLGLSALSDAIAVGFTSQSKYFWAFVLTHPASVLTGYVLFAWLRPFREPTLADANDRS